ncbi:MAG: polysaccharide biosynthesis/export family protein [Rhodobacteraceae bacterium]|nr:polysaccharide biosynthesis/export family protein [Paracoccaceae bacterium]
MGKHNTTSRKVRLAALMSMLLVLGACGLPRSGPSQAEIMAGSVENGGSTNIVMVDDRVARAATLSQPLGFSRSFLNAGLAAVDRIRAGDLITITIWENVDNGLLAETGASSTTLSDIEVDQLGNIFVPYAGTIRASGRTPEGLRTDITRELERQTPDPQVEVRRKPGNGAAVNVVGGVNKQGVYLLHAASRRLTAMLASAGGISLDPAGTKVIVQRGNESGAIWLRDLYSNPKNDITLRANDRIIVEKDERYFSVLGATTGQARIDFTSRNPSIVDALSLIGGLNSRIADPRGIFIFRMETADIANKVLDTTQFTTPQRVAYVIDLTTDESIFTAQTFKIRDRDTIYVTEAPFVGWTRVLESIAGTVNTLDSLATVASAL